MNANKLLKSSLSNKNCFLHLAVWSGLASCLSVRPSIQFQYDFLVPLITLAATKNCIFNESFAHKNTKVGSAHHHYHHRHEQQHQLLLYYMQHL